MLTFEQTIALIIALGGGVFFREIWTGAWKWFTGRQTRERDSLQLALRRYDKEAERRRKLEEYASSLRRIIIEAGLEKLLPPFPSTPDPDFTDINKKDKT